MIDVVDRITRSRMMSGVRGKDTKPELLIRRALHRLGFRFRLHAAGLPGRPDIVLPKYRAAILVHGCFWHRHEGCAFATTPATNVEFWKSKFEQNVLRDARNLANLWEAGWRTAIVWECAFEKNSLEKLAKRLAVWLETRKTFLEIPKCLSGNILNHRNHL
jgi:DNA mismatch endonuclease, patch repair protein